MENSKDIVPKKLFLSQVTSNSVSIKNDKDSIKEDAAYISKALSATYVEEGDEVIEKKMEYED